MTAQQTKLHPQVETVLNELGRSSEQRENECYELFLEGNYDRVKAFRLEDLSNSYFRCLSYLSSAVTVANSANKSNLPTVLSEAAGACADYKREACLKRLSSSLMSA